MTPQQLAATVVALVLLSPLVWVAIWAHRGAHLDRLLAACFKEQSRRESAHHIVYRPDQRVHACQQRLARKLGRRRAFSKKLEREIRAGLGLA